MFKHVFWLPPCEPVPTPSTKWRESEDLRRKRTAHSRTCSLRSTGGNGMEQLGQVKTRMHMILTGGSTCADIDGCSGVPKCSKWAKCCDVPSPGVGFACSACPPGYSGDGKSCVPAACAKKTATDAAAGPCGWNAISCLDITHEMTWVRYHTFTPSLSNVVNSKNTQCLWLCVCCYVRKCVHCTM